MDDPQVDRFMERLKQDRALGQEYQAALNGALESAVVSTVKQVAERHGFQFTTEAVRAHLEQQVAEVSDEELKSITGGWGIGRGGSGSGLGFLSNPLVLAGIVAAAIAIPLAVSNDDDDAS